MATVDDAAEWRAIQDFPDYEVSDDGRVRRITRPKSTRWKNRLLPFELSLGCGPHGYRIVILTSPTGERSTKRVNRLVALAFLPPPLPGQDEAAHDDGDNTNNRVGNLKWATSLENDGDKRRHGTHFRAKGELHGCSKLTEEQVREILATPKVHGSGVALAKKFGVTKSAIYEIRWGVNWPHLRS